MPDIVNLYRHLIHPRTKEVLDGLAKPTKVNDHRLGGKIRLCQVQRQGRPRDHPRRRHDDLCLHLRHRALISLPSAIKSHNLTIIIAWISSNFLQLVLLPIIIVGQNIQAAASDKRAEDTYKDAEAVLHEAVEIQKHLASQDEAITEIVNSLRGMAPAET